MLLDFNYNQPELLYGDVPAFMGVPAIGNDEQKMKGQDAIFLGIPFDGMATYRGGATRNATASIRKFSLLYGGYNIEYDLNIYDYINVADMGDVDIVPGKERESFDRAEVLVDKILNAGAIPIVIGGDHSISIPVVKAVARHKKKKFGLVIFDTHLDLKEHRNGNRFTRSSPTYRHLENEEIDPDHVVIIGARGPRNHKSQVDIVKERGIHVFTMRDVDDLGIKEVAQQAFEYATVDGEPPYISIDIDALDCGIAPATNSPEPGGLTTREVVNIMRVVAQNGFQGLDLVEVAPEWDGPCGQTSVVSAKLLAEGLALLAQSRKNSENE